MQTLSPSLRALELAARLNWCAVQPVRRLCNSLSQVEAIYEAISEESSDPHHCIEDDGFWVDSDGHWHDDDGYWTDFGN